LFYTHLDNAYGFWQVRVRDEDIHKTARQTHDGPMEWVAMSFGMCSAPNMFKRMMNDILRDFLHKLMTVCLDDVCVCSRTMEEQLEHLRLVLQRLREEVSKMCIKKCFFGLQAMEYLGYILYASKTSVSTKKIEAFAHWPVHATTQKEARSFVKLYYLYAKFIHHFSDLAVPLTNLLRLKSRPQKVTLTCACLEAFKTLKLRLISAPCLIL
jgi:hypothetical protein